MHAPRDLPIHRPEIQPDRSQQEATGAVVGDVLMPDPDIVATRAVEIDAPPSAIWPWLVMPLIVLVAFYALYRVHQRPGDPVPVPVQPVTAPANSAQ